MKRAIIILVQVFLITLGLILRGILARI